jgi:hypothetical protein
MSLFLDILITEPIDRMKSRQAKAVLLEPDAPEVFIWLVGRLDSRRARIAAS